MCQRGGGWDRSRESQKRAGSRIQQVYDMMLPGVQIDRGHVVMAGDIPDKNIAGPSRTGGTFLLGDEVWVCTSGKDSHWTG